MELSSEMASPNADITPYDLYQRYTRSALFQGMRPVILTLRVFGLYFTKNYETPDIESSEQIGCTKRTVCTGPLRVTGSHVYSEFVLVLHWLNVIRMFTMIDPKDGFGSLLFQKLLFLSSVTISATNTTALFYGWHNTEALPSFFSVWAQLHIRGSKGKLLDNFRKRMIIYTAITSLILLCNIGFIAYGLTISHLLDAVITPLTLEGAAGITVKLIYSFTVNIYMSVSALFPFLFAYVVCSVCYTEFRDLKDEFRKLIAKDGTFTGDMEYFRRKHQLICHLVKHADNYFSIQAVGVLLLYSLALMVIIYNLITYNEIRENPWSLAMHIFWTTFGLLCVGIICIGAAFVNDEAHTLAFDIADIKIDHKSCEIGIQISLFMSRLTGSPIGLSAMKMFVIDKQMILAWSGMMITYFVLIIQFAPLNSLQAGCHCSDNIANSTLQ